MADLSYAIQREKFLKETAEAWFSFNNDRMGAFVSTSRQRLEVIRGFAADIGPPRTLRIFRPRAYERDPKRTFPVLLLTDGQNMLDVDAAIDPAWGADACMDRLIAERAVEPWLIVAMDHLAEKRLSDYGPWPDPHLPLPAHGARYAALVAERLLPFLERHHRARIDAGSVAMVGSSLGGLIALYVGLVRPDRVGRVGALSPSVMWKDEVHRAASRLVVA